MMEISPLSSIWESFSLSTFAWLLSYMIHSTVLLATVLFLDRVGVLRSILLKELLWKVALIGSLVTASLQSMAGYQPLAGQFSLHDWTSSASGEKPGDFKIERPDAILSRMKSFQQDHKYLLLKDHREAGRERLHVERTVTAVPKAAARRQRIRKEEKVFILYPSKLYWVQWVIAGWFVVVTILALRVGIALMRLARLLRRRRTLADGPVWALFSDLLTQSGVRRQIKLTCSPHLAGPIALWGREICLPERALTELGQEQQESLLAHELAHVLRRDPWWLLLCTGVETVFFLQPLNRIARQRLRDEAECLCDDWAVRVTGNKLSLAKCLAEVATWVKQTPQPAFVSTMSSQASPLMHRIRRILGDHQRPGEFARWLRVLIAAATLTLVAWAAPSISVGRKLLFIHLRSVEQVNGAVQIPARRYVHVEVGHWLPSGSPEGDD